MTVNYLAVLVSAIAAMAIGSVWFGPLFGKKYMAAMGFDSMSPEKREAMKKGMAMTYIWQFVASLVMFYVFDRFLLATGHSGVSEAMKVALGAWIGFIVPLKLGDALWGGKMVLFWLSIGNSLLTLAVAGLIIGAWK